MSGVELKSDQLQDDISAKLLAFDEKRSKNNSSTKMLVGFFVYFVLITVLFFLIFSQQQKMSLIESINKNSVTPRRKIQTVSPFPKKKQ